MRQIIVPALPALLALGLATGTATAQGSVFTSLTEVAPPTGPGAREPSLFALPGGRILLGWSEPVPGGFAVRAAIGTRAGFDAPGTVTAAPNLFVNWADFPSVAAFADGTLAAHFLQENGPSTYDYDLKIALSADHGATWSVPLTPHRDASIRQHGFATLLPDGDNLLAIWLDGRAYDIRGADTPDNAMQLRAATVSPQGKISEDILLDRRTCTCCQTSAAVTDSGVVLAAYRDRSDREIRDISVLRRINGVWSGPTRVHADNWQIDGCPVNGPAIDTAGERAVVAWFTAANDVPAVKLAFSDDAGTSFGPPIRVDQGDAAGRVDVVALADGSALISWVEWQDAGEALMVCRIVPGGACDAPETITLNTTNGVINFPRMVGTEGGVWITWTQPLEKPDAGPEQDLTIRLLHALF